MRITVRQLKALIREQIKKMDEMYISPAPPEKQFLDYHDLHAEWPGAEAEFSKLQDEYPFEPKPELQDVHTHRGRLYAFVDIRTRSNGFHKHTRIIWTPDDVENPDEGGYWEWADIGVVPPPAYTMNNKPAWHKKARAELKSAESAQSTKTAPASAPIEQSPEQ